ncbi:hypothetical protein [Flectobacillus roseus]|uniref:Uncharacterized protein n=1 Tax=Flectobacillus roseus TaxID=502259 RepID=A0ABT6Y342_9BACT|nr:hypothetical protein [Flectobacillus roseus]MDI9857984.1 hypothetical protein [Flectobacillus roseus]
MKNPLLVIAFIFNFYYFSTFKVESELTPQNYVYRKSSPKVSNDVRSVQETQYVYYAKDVVVFGYMLYNPSSGMLEGGLPNHGPENFSIELYNIENGRYMVSLEGASDTFVDNIQIYKNIKEQTEPPMVLRTATFPKTGREILTMDLGSVDLIRGDVLTIHALRNGRGTILPKVRSVKLRKIR